MVRHRTLEFCHIRPKAYGENAGAMDPNRKYARHELPDPPRHGSTVAEVTCKECSNIYRIRIHSRNRHFIISATKWFFFPLLVLATIGIPVFLYHVDSWEIYFSVSLIAWFIFCKLIGKHGYSRVKLIKRLAKKYAQHRVMDPAT